jgi:hypothetical protein
MLYKLVIIVMLFSAGGDVSTTTTEIDTKSLDGCRAAAQSLTRVTVIKSPRGDTLGVSKVQAFCMWEQ